VAKIIRVAMRTCPDCSRTLPLVCFIGPRCQTCHRKPRPRIRIFLEREPLLAEIAAWRAQHSMMALAQRAGVPDRSIRRIVSGESAHVRLDLADKLAMAMDQPLGLMYPWE
jgi:hypothetical protein